MLKKIVKKTLITLLVALIAFSYCFYNLKHYSVFYAKHTPHKAGVEPVLMELVDNLWWIERPEIEGIKYDFDGTAAVYNANYADLDIPLFSSGGNGGYFYCNAADLSYTFTEHFDLELIKNGRAESIALTSVIVNSIKKDIYKIVQPVIDASQVLILV